MDKRIIHDPHLNEIPDHAGPHYEVLQNAFTQNGMDVEQAVQALNDSWTQNHNTQIQAWDQQVADDTAALAAQLAVQQVAADQQATQQPVPEGEVADAEKKKPN